MTNRKNSTGIYLFCILLISLLLLASSATASVFSQGGGGEWDYYREITITENSGKTLGNYQVLVKLAGSNFPTSARSNGDDIRFIDSEGNELSCWIEDYDAGAKVAMIWVKIPSVRPNEDVKIKMWYGNPSATTVSDGDAVFDFFDDFDSASLDGGKWYTNCGSPLISDDVLSLSGACIVSESVRAFGYNYIFESRSKMSDTGNEPRCLLRSTNDYTVTNGWDRFEFGSWKNVDEIQLQIVVDGRLTTVTEVRKFPTSF
ncbi:MAG: DUF2341 domain-containing protein, partial [Methanosarcinales archaeon]